MSKIVIVSRPITDASQPYILLKNPDQSFQKYALAYNDPVFISKVEPDKKHCTGWYDIATHTNFICDNGRAVDLKYESCFECRKKTGFNPAFYNTAEISDVQNEYNNQPHSVYVSYFGNGLAKAGIMSDSRGLERIYEQGALFYCIVDTRENAAKAHDIESQLIASGLKNSVTKRQKEKSLTVSLDLNTEEKKFLDTLKNLDLSDKKVISNLDHFFFGSWPKETIEPIGNNVLSGNIRGIVGRYLILSNNERLYGVWLSDLFGYEIEIEKTVKDIKAEPRQISLFG